MAKRLAVAVSQAQSQNPAKRQLEEDIVAALLFEPGLDVLVVPHLYDLAPGSTGLLALEGIGGDLVVLSWLFPRAAHWTLDRNGVRGRVGKTLLVSEEEDDEAEPDDEDAAEEDAAKERVIDTRPLPRRTIYCLDLRAHERAEPFIAEIKRIFAEGAQQVVGLGEWIAGSPTPAALARYEHPQNDTALGGSLAPASGNGQSGNAPLGNAPSGNGQSQAAAQAASTGERASVVRIEETPGRRWYPVIDYSRCTNCMECIDFCLFGVYGVDDVETILVELPDNCRKGCPACSRVCPENAILFPQHKTPAIAGAAAELGGLKIDLSLLFGAPDEGKSAAELAVKERDEQLLLAGRSAVGESVGLRRRSEQHTAEPKDGLDSLIDQLDDLDL